MHLGFFACLPMTISLAKESIHIYSLFWMLIRKGWLSNSLSLLALGNWSAKFLANVIAKFSFYLAINSELMPSGEIICEYRESYMKGHKYIERLKYININVSILRKSGITSVNCWASNSWNVKPKPDPAKFCNWSVFSIKCLLSF